jgi:hypothetical protein
MRCGDRIKILWHDGLGMSLYAKRLERGRFIWPSPADGVVSITPAQLAYLLEALTGGGILQADAFAWFNALYEPSRKPEPITRRRAGAMPGASSLCWLTSPRRRWHSRWRAGSTPSSMSSAP